MKNPLTKAELRQIKRNFDSTFDEVYSKIMKSGALSEDFFKPHNHMIARFSLIIAAEKFAPIEKYRKELDNLAYFV